MPWRFLWRIFCFRKLLGSFYSAAVVLSRISECRRYLLPSVKRSLKLDGLLEENSFDPSKITRKKSVITYSPTTGTCQMSLFASPTSSEEQKHRNGLSNGLCWKP
ncbi:centromere protein R isoform X8 [Homo sapiens]|uniref:centromere protein R isoform X8 n=1 Tax=Homo sapiens TaxID=9606 RepID=UPI0023DFEFD5|nr:centromere protein R isoform X8 [Homo sapiens]